MCTRQPGGRIEHFSRRDSHADIHPVNDRVPVAAKLANLLGVDIEQKTGALPVAVGECLHVRHLQPTARYRGENAHQRTLGIAIVNVKCVHTFFPILLVLCGDSRPRLSSRAKLDNYSSSNNISESAAP